MRERSLRDPAQNTEGNDKALAVVSVSGAEQRRVPARRCEDRGKQVRRMDGKQKAGPHSRSRVGTRMVKFQGVVRWVFPLPQWLVNILACSREALLVLLRGPARCTERIEALAKPAKECPSRPQLSQYTMGKPKLWDLRQ